MCLVKKKDIERLQAMIRYCSLTDCLRHYILRYFGETAPDQCGFCGNCVNARRAAPVTDTQDTFHNYGGVVPVGLLDYVFVSENVTPLVFHVIDDKLDGAYLSDHYGVFVDLAL